MAIGTKQVLVFSISCQLYSPGVHAWFRLRLPGIAEIAFRKSLVTKKLAKKML